MKAAIAIGLLVIFAASSGDAATVDTLWSRYYDETTTDIAEHVGFDAMGNVYSAGTPYWIVVKYYPEGDTAWSVNTVVRSMICS